MQTPTARTESPAESSNGLATDLELARFAANLSRLRAAYDLSREKLAHQIGTSAKALEHWETSTGNPPIRCIVRLATLFGLTTDELLGVEQQQPDQSSRLSLLLRLGHAIDAHEARLAQLEADIARTRVESKSGAH
jgi:Predicted transcriptional regulators